MRVIWISIVLFVVLVVAGIGLYEPDNDPVAPAAIEKPLDNPFAEERTASNDVDLPALPRQSLPVEANITEPQSGAENSVSSIDSIEDSTIDNPPTEPMLPGVSKPQNAVGEISNNVNTAVKTVSSTDSVNQAVLQTTENELANAPKLGLAMLELEKENKRNKVAVIVHQDNPQQLTVEDIKAMYMDRLTRWQDGSKVMLYNLPLGDKFREKFSQNILNMTALQADSEELQRRELNIKVNPVEVKAKNIVISYVEQHPNAVAYVPLVMVREKSNVKVIMTIP